MKKHLKYKINYWIPNFEIQSIVELQFKNLGRTI